MRVCITFACALRVRVARFGKGRFKYIHKTNKMYDARSNTLQPAWHSAGRAWRRHIITHIQLVQAQKSQNCPPSKAPRGAPGAACSHQSQARPWPGYSPGGLSGGGSSRASAATSIGSVTRERKGSRITALADHADHQGPPPTCALQRGRGARV